MTAESAFPTEFESGMTLRDYFAAAALTALGNQMYNDDRDSDFIATAAYVIADAMLKAREQK